MRIVCPRGLVASILSAALAGAACSPGAGTGATAGPSVAAVAAWTWEAVDPDPASEAGPQAVTGWDGAYVGVGFGRAWTSPDGRTWSSSALPEADPGYGWDIVATPGFLVALGSSGDRPDTWISTDGRAWTRSGDPDLGPTGASIDHLANGPAGIVAVGTELKGGGQHPMAWWSADGLDWVRTGDALVGGGARDVASGTSGYVMVGADTVPANDLTKAAFWFSPDGKTWEAIPDDGTRAFAEPQAVTGTEDGFVAVGFQGTIGGMGAALSPIAWTSKDGRAWTRAEPTADMAAWPFPGPTPVADEGALQGGVMWDVAKAPSGLLAVGSYWGLDPEVEMPEGGHGFAQAGAAWRAPDASAWELLEEPFVRIEPGNDTTSPKYGFQRVTTVGSTPLIIGTTREGGAVLWLGRPAES